MSTGCECLFIEVKPGEWWYVLEDYDAPKNSWDWREHARAFGSFPSMEAANRHLSRNHANPGGCSEQPYEEGYEPDEVMERLMKEARASRAARNRFR